MSKIVGLIWVLVASFSIIEAQESSQGESIRRPPSIRGDVAFSVRKATEHLRAPSRLHFEDVLTNLGGGWKHSTSEFIAPLNGGYFFIFHAVSAERSSFQIDLMKNDRTQVTAYGTRGSYEHGSSSVFLELRKRDRIHLEIAEGEIYEHPRNEAYTTFSGFLVLNYD
ncbi:cerebellin-2-like [Panulirus ornatus]|uniref:cerebellin-2-like n=1 Tax=Panulirus ornatus TaxID=150431 RepID=UPI003A8727C7